MRIWLALWDMPDVLDLSLGCSISWSGEKKPIFGLNADFFGFYRITKQQSAYLCYDHTHTMRGVSVLGFWDWN